jgi:predicted RNA binding protein YcfA (HicA-like mRNA interferase family)
VSLRQKGSHEFLHHPDCRRLTVSIHSSAEAGPSIVKKIIRDAGLTEERFLEVL